MATAREEQALLSEQKSGVKERFKSVQRGEARGARANPKQDGMSAKVLEMWVKETLTDAEASEIPGTIATTEYKDTLKRYGVDR